MLRNTNIENSHSIRRPRSMPNVLARCAALVALPIWAFVSAAMAEDETTTQPDSTAESITFFESQVRPLLAKRCYECHSHEKKMKAGELFQTCVSFPQVLIAK